jgi:excisionase family DNA binding protein
VEKCTEVTQPLLVNKREAAALLGISVRTLENLIASKELPVRRIGRRVLVLRSKIVQFINSDHPTSRRRVPHV